MARRGEEAEEIFTDLNGTPESAPAAEIELLDDITLVDQPEKVRRQEDNSDLEVVDDEVDEAAAAATPAAEDEVDEEIEEVPAQAAVEGFDPKDVQIVVLQSSALEQREKTTKSAQERAKADAEEAKTAIIAAKESGDSKAEVTAMEKFADAKAAYQTAAAQLENIATEKAGIASRAQALMARAPKGADGKPILTEKVEAREARAAGTKVVEPGQGKGSKLTAKFLGHNAWFNDPKQAAAKETLLGIDRAMAKEGKLDKNDPVYFKEMGTRFNKLHPGVYKDLDGKPIATGQRQRGSGTPVPGGAGGGGGGGGGSQQQAGKVRLTSADLDQMRVFGLDPSDMKARRAWLNEKIAAAKAEKRAA